MIPDRTSGRILRSVALLLYALCGACALVDLGGCDSSKHGATGARRIVSVGGAVTETVFALGAGHEVVAVDTSSVYPDGAQHLPKVGYQRTLSAEGILALSPDLVIVSDEAGPPATLELLRHAGVRVARMPSAQTLEEAIARITAVGAAIGRPSRALAAQVRREASAALGRVPADRPRFVLVYARGAGTLMVAGGDTGGSAMVEFAGGHNAVSELRGFKPLSAEVLIEAMPDVLVVPSRGLATIGGDAGLLALPGVADTPAGRNRRIIAFDDLLLLSFGPRLPQSIDELARLLRRGSQETAALR
jgi:iron complex transport system substrate-binding protein